MAEKEEVILFMTSMSCSLEVKKKCQHINTIMCSKSKTHTLKEVDVSKEGVLKTMREKLDDPKALPPQLYSDKYGYLGSYEKFHNSVEEEQLNEFLNNTYET